MAATVATQNVCLSGHCGPSERGYYRWLDWINYSLFLIVLAIRIANDITVRARPGRSSTITYVAFPHWIGFVAVLYGCGAVDRRGRLRPFSVACGPGR